MTAGRGRRPSLALATAMLAASGCTTTVDSLGYNGPDRIVLHTLASRAPYPNPFRDLLGKTDADISAKIAAAYAQLFHGDPNTQAIYFPVDTNQAFIKDILHNDVRTEGVGYAMLISVELDKRDEFDRLWTYAKATMKVTAGAATDYFNSACDTAAGPTPCLDPFGMQQFLMSLLLANDRWGATPGGEIYGSDAKDLLTVMRHKQDANGGVVDGVTDVFDARAKLPFDLPDVKLANQGRPSIAIPAYYDLWREATDDPFWSGAAASARAYLQRATNTMTGLSPVKEGFDGTAVPGSDTFQSESFRTLLNLALDCAWSEGSHCDVATSNLLIRFFTAQGDRYGSAFTLDGTTVLDPTHDDALTAANGAAALVATANERVPFVNAVWSIAAPSGLPRYYSGLLYLLSLLVLGGQLQVY